MQKASGIDILLAPVNEFDGAIVEYKGQTVMILRETLSPLEQDQMCRQLLAEISPPETLPLAA